MQRSDVEIICNHMLGVIQLDDDSLIEISGEELSLYSELTPLDD